MNYESGVLSIDGTVHPILYSMADKVYICLLYTSYNKFYAYFQYFLGIKQIAFVHICVILMLVCCLVGFFENHYLKETGHVKICLSLIHI